MRKLRNKYTITPIVLALLYSASAIYANSTTAGNTVTVNRNSGFNALRSPALMSWQNTDSIGIGHIYSLQAYYNLDGSINVGVVSGSVDGDSSSIYKGSILFSCVFRKENQSFGIGIRSNDDAQFAISESSTDIALVGSYTDEKKMIINASSVFSYSYRFSNRQSLGIQAETGYTIKSIEKEKTESGNEQNVETETESISGSVVLGYSFIGNSIEAGLMIKGGEFSIESTDLSYKQTNTAPYSGDVSIDTDILQNKGYGIMAGLLYKFNYKLLFSLEAGAEIPYEYERESIQDDSPFIKIDNEIKSSGVYLLRIGADYSINRSISAGIGGTYVYTKSESNRSDDKLLTTDVNLVEVTAGVEYRFLNGIQMLLSCSFLYVKSGMGMEVPVSSLTAELDSDALYVNFVTGISTAF